MRWASIWPWALGAVGGLAIAEFVYPTKDAKQAAKENFDAILKAQGGAPVATLPTSGQSSISPSAGVSNYAYIPGHHFILNVYTQASLGLTEQEIIDRLLPLGWGSLTPTAPSLAKTPREAPEQSNQYAFKAIWMGRATNSVTQFTPDMYIAITPEV